MATKKKSSPSRVRLKASPGCRLGLDENGLGPRLGPMIVTAAQAQVSEEGARRFYRKLPKSIHADLDDSKGIVSCHDYSIAEAWARVIVERKTGEPCSSPNELLGQLAGVSVESLLPLCPPSTAEQCWNIEGESFVSSEEQCARVQKHLLRFEEMGIAIENVRSEVVCTGKLNLLKSQGVHRFAADLHAMERLIIGMQAEKAAMVEAVCGKVGGIGKYEPFFGPLAGRLHTALEEGQAKSSYYFPGLGTIHFVRDADGSDPLVMLASMVGKFLRELLMGRVARFYADVVSEPESMPSGYHDPITQRFVAQTEKKRKKLKIVSDCFERRPANRP